VIKGLRADGTVFALVGVAEQVVGYTEVIHPDV
jgi:hypothetical protein